MKIKQGFKKEFGTVIARSGAGKTALCFLLMMAKLKPCLVIDNYEQFEHDYEMTFEELIEAFNDADFRESFYKYKKVIVIRLGNTTLDTFFHLLMKSGQYNDLLVFVDEIDMTLGQSEITNKHGFYQFLNRGRHKNFDLLTTCRNTANIPKQLIGQTDYFYFSDLMEKGAIDFVKETLKGMEVVDEIQELKEHHFMQVDVKAKTKATLNPDIKWCDYFA